MKKCLKAPGSSFLLGIPFLFVVGSLFHFLYDLSGQSPVVGAFAPVNESVWEHQKMVLLPVILWWTAYYFARRNPCGIDQTRWFTGMTVSLVTAILTIPFVFYFYTGAFGIERLAIDILILLLADTAGQLLGMHFYRHSRGLPLSVSIGIALAIVLIFVLFTFCTPHIPWFQDSITGQYGI